MKFLLALSACVAVASGASIYKSVYYTKTDCSGDVQSETFLTGFLTCSAAGDVTYTEFDDDTCTTAIGSGGCTGFGSKLSCESSVSGSSGFHKTENHVPTGCSLSTATYECDNTDGDVYSTVFQNNACVNLAAAQNVTDEDGELFEAKSYKVDCANKRAVYHADEDCSGDTANGEKADDDCATYTCGGCYVASAAYGSAENKNVASLRAARDAYMGNNAAMRAVWSLYESFGPAAANVLGQSAVARAVLTPLSAAASLIA
jgi:hypothetical protein